MTAGLRHRKLPMIIAGGVISIGSRRVLSHENIYTIKLIARRHFIPKALHANMFLVRRAVDVMDKDILILPDPMGFLTSSSGDRKGRDCAIS